MSKILKKEKERMSNILNILSKEYPDVRIQLNFETPFQLLIATILSAQCTDARVNLVTQKLFAKYITIEDFTKVPQEELEKDVFSTGFYKSKAEKIQKTSKIISEEYNGEVPSTMDELLKLPGVGRKTANVLLGHIFDTPGIVVDTHVLRISKRLGFTNTENAEKVEFALMKLIPEDLWVIFTHYFINHGRKVCMGRRPKCYNCSVEKYCEFESKIFS
ncbi:MAG: endonuclease III [Ignavibacteria bacterium GWF2_33_9]|nr:MAG: endonuclease III [Ignavibacteria bacterium GWF2_33_9]